MKKNLILYTCKNGDTLENIARNASCSVLELKRINHLTRDTLHLNQPLLVPYINHDRGQYAINKTNSQEVFLFLFYLKETLLSSLYFEDAFSLLKEKTNSYLLSFSKNYNQNKFVNKIMLFGELLKKKDEKMLLEYEHNLKKDLDNLFSQDDNFFSLAALKYLKEQFQLYILKMGNKNYKDAENIFNEIISLDYTLF